MRIYDTLTSKDIDGLAEWLDKYGMFDQSPWLTWWDNNYCKKCDGVEYKGQDWAWCELNGKCKFFQDLKDIPDNKQIIKMWLELEVEDENEFSDNIDEAFSSYFGL